MAIIGPSFIARLERFAFQDRPWSCSLRKSFRVVSSCISHEYPDLKPWLRLVRMLLYSKRLIIFLQMMCSRILQVTDVSDTGR